MNDPLKHRVTVTFTFEATLEERAIKQRVTEEERARVFHTITDFIESLNEEQRALLLADFVASALVASCGRLDDVRRLLIADASDPFVTYSVENLPESLQDLQARGLLVAPGGAVASLVECFKTEIVDCSWQEEDGTL